MSGGGAPERAPGPGDEAPPSSAPPMRSRTIETCPGGGADFAVHHPWVSGSDLTQSRTPGQKLSSASLGLTARRPGGCSHASSTCRTERLSGPGRATGPTVPAGVARTFARGGRNLQRTHDRHAARVTAAYCIVISRANCARDRARADAATPAGRPVRAPPALDRRSGTTGPTHVGPPASACRQP